MRAIEIKSDSKSLQVLKNIDFVLRTKSPKSVLITADYPEENHANLADSIARQLNAVYGSKIYILDLAKEQSSVDFDLSDAQAANIYIDELSKHNDFIFVIHNVNKNIKNTTLPEFNLDSALIVRSKKSIGLNRSRYITNLLKDADIEVLGLVENRD